MMTYLLFFIGFAALIKGADFLVDGASSIARKLNISDLVIGLTVVAFGTSAPELFVNIFASAKGNTAIAIGNVIGSNLVNILLILGVSAVIIPLNVSGSVVMKGVPLGFLAVLTMGVLANDKLIEKTGVSALTRVDGIILLFFFVIFLYYSFGAARTVTGIDELAPSKRPGIFLSILFVILGLIGLIVGGQWIVNGAVSLAQRIGASQSLIGLTVVAVGTSLPELATSVVAASKKNVDIAVGNVIGSNIFNIFFVLGISSIVKPLPWIEGQNTELGFLVIVSFLLFLFMFSGKRHTIDRWEGKLFILLYGLYLAFIIFRG